MIEQDTPLTLVMKASAAGPAVALVELAVVPVVALAAPVELAAPVVVLAAPVVVPVAV